MAACRGTVVRPLLDARRADTRALCAALGLPVFDDPMNDDRAFRRVAIRHDVLPYLSALAERDLVPVLARQAAILRSDSEFLDDLAARAWPGGEGDDHEARAAALVALPLPLARRALRQWLGAPPPSLAEIDRVLAVASGDARRDRARPWARGASISRTARPDRRLASPSVDLSAIGGMVVDEDELQTRIRELGKEITADYEGRPPLLVGVLKGAFVFMSDLSRAIDLPVEFDFMAVSSYGSATRSSGVVRILKDLDLDLTDRHVLIVEDIVDSGLTLAYLRRTWLHAVPASMEVCALLVKEGLQRVELDLKYVGFTIPPTFVVGYGLDVGERFRNLPYIAEYAGPEAV